MPGTPPTYRYDEARAESQVARLAVDAALQRAAGRADAFAPVQQPMQTVGSRYIDWLVPGLLGMNIMGTGMWGVGFAIVNARAKKLLKRLVATPMSKSHYLLSLVFSRMATLSLEVIVIVGFAWIFFGVAVHGALWALAALAIIGALAFGGLGLLVASRARTIEAVSGLMNLVMLPMWVLSGVFFASTNFPEAMQPFIHVLPLTALNDALRLVVNEGRPFDAVLPQVAHPRGVGRHVVRVVAETVSLAVERGLDYLPRGTGSADDDRAQQRFGRERLQAAPACRPPTRAARRSARHSP